MSRKCRWIERYFWIYIFAIVGGWRNYLALLPLFIRPPMFWCRFVIGDVACALWCRCAAAAAAITDAVLAEFVALAGDETAATCAFKWLCVWWWVVWCIECWCWLCNAADELWCCNWCVDELETPTAPPAELTELPDPAEPADDEAEADWCSESDVDDDAEWLLLLLCGWCDNAVGDVWMPECDANREVWWWCSDADAELLDVGEWLVEDAEFNDNWWWLRWWLLWCACRWTCWWWCCCCCCCCCCNCCCCCWWTTAANWPKWWWWWWCWWWCPPVLVDDVTADAELRWFCSCCPVVDNESGCASDMPDSDNDGMRSIILRKIAVNICLLAWLRLRVW